MGGDREWSILVNNGPFLVLFSVFGCIFRCLDFEFFAWLVSAVLGLCSEFRVGALGGVAGGRMRGRGWAVLGGGPFLVVFVTVINHTYKVTFLSFPIT